MGDDTGTEKKSSACLAQTEAEFRAIFEDAAIGIAVLDFKGRPVRCNPAFERILGYTEEELCRMSFPEFTHPDDLQADMELYHSLLAGERDYYQIEKRYIRKDAKTVWTRLTISLVHQDSRKPEYVVGMVEDITAQKEAQEALRESEEKFFKAFHACPNPTLITRRANGLILEVNRAFGQWFGIPASEVRGKKTSDFGVWKSTSERRELLKLLEQRGTLRDHEKLIELPSGERRTTLITVQPISIHGEDCLLVLSNDITQQKQAEQSLREAQDRELRSREEFTRQLLNAEEQERQRLAAELHDSLGQNLSIIQNNVDLALAHAGIPAAAVEHLKAISQVASDTLGEVRDLVRNLRPLQIEQLGLTDSIRELAEKVALSTPILIELRIENVDDAIQGASATHLYRIVQEALNNLTRHSRASRANLSLERDIKCVRLQVSDNGCGFEVKPAAVRGGFGLRNMRERAQMLGGSLNLESTPGRGAKLRVEVPIHDHGGPEA